MVFVFSINEMARIAIGLVLVCAAVYLFAPVYVPFMYFHKHGMELQLWVLGLSWLLLLGGLAALVKKRWFIGLLCVVLFAGGFAYSAVRMTWKYDIAAIAGNEYPFAKAESLTLRDNQLSMESYLWERHTKQNNWLDYILACRVDQYADTNMFEEQWNSFMKTPREKKCGTPEDVRQAYGVDLRATVRRIYTAKQEVLRDLKNRGVEACLAKGECERISSFEVRYAPRDVTVPFLMPDATVVPPGDPYYANYRQTLDILALQQQALLGGRFDDPKLCFYTAECAVLLGNNL